jgi:hypothetical protein
MKSFKVREGRMLVDGVYYSENPSEANIKGKVGRIQSISVSGRQFFPYGGEYIDDTIKVTEDNTGLMEETKPIKKTRKTK